MTKIYSTSSFLQDISPSLDAVVTKLSMLTKLILKHFGILLNSEIEVGIVELLIQIPIFVFIIILGFIMILVLVNNSEPVNGYRISTILSKSMEPSIKSGSIVFVTPPKNIKIGDIILFAEKSTVTDVQTGRRLMHRIVGEKSVNGGKAYVTKGDANAFPDPGFLYFNDIYGKVFISIPYIGYLNLLLHTKWGLVMFLVMPEFLLVYSEVKVIRKYFALTKN